MGSKIPCQNLDAEESILATLLVNNKYFQECDHLRPDEFYKTSHQILFKTMCRMNSKEKPVDIVTLTAKLKEKDNFKIIGGASYIIHLVDYAALYNIKSYIKIVKDCALTRKVNEICMGVIDSQTIGEVLLEQAQSDILKIQSTSQEDDIKNVKDIVIDHLNRLEKANTTKEGAGYKLGFPALDRYLRIKEGKLIIIAGRPGSGKTAFAVTAVRNLDKQGVGVGFLSIEMPSSEIMDRWLSIESNVDSSKFNKYNQLNKKDLQMLNDAGEHFYHSKIKIDESGSLDIVDVQRKCRKLKKDGCQVIFIDQLSQIGNRLIKAGELTALYSENCTKLARLKKELDIPLFVLHQLNRSAKDRGIKEPILTDLKQSGKIEEDADAVIFIHRPEMYEQKEEVKAELKGLTKIIIAKNRSGATYSDKTIIFDDKTTYFYQGVE